MRKTISIMAAFLVAATACTFAGCEEKKGSSDVSTLDSAVEATTLDTEVTTSLAATTPAATLPVTTVPVTTTPAPTKPKATMPTTTAPAVTNPSQQKKTQINQNEQAGQSGQTGSSKSSGGSTPHIEQQQESPKTVKQEGSFSAADTNFVYNGVTVALNGDMNNILPLLGEPVSVESQTSCHGVGDDKTFLYDSFVINTYPVGNKDCVLEIIVSDAGVQTAKGIRVGSNESDVIAAYGEDYSKRGMYYAYETSDGKSLQFFMQNGTVTEVDYYYDA